MKYYVDAKARCGDGSVNAPFKTIGEAAKIAGPGDEVIIAPGIYREYIDPQNAGTKDAPIIYRAQKRRSVIVTGAELVKNWNFFQGDVWSVKIENDFFGNYNPYLTVIKGDWFDSKIPFHT